MLVDAGWEEIYRSARPEDLPWFTETVDADIDATLKRLKVGPQDGPILDLGTGPGTFAIEMAKRKFQVVALDVSQNALRMAQQRAGGYAPRIEWVAADVLACDWPARFQLIHDRGAYHSLPIASRRAYAKLVPTWLRPGGYLLLKTFHVDEPGDWGPNRISKDELTKHFGTRLETVEIAPTVFPGGLDHEPKAWRAVFRSPQTVP